ncbi:hypothetical protein C3L33_01055, partial [Rhododendron williamsianum]
MSSSCRSTTTLHCNATIYPESANLSRTKVCTNKFSCVGFGLIAGETYINYAVRFPLSPTGGEAEVALGATKPKPWPIDGAEVAVSGRGDKTYIEQRDGKRLEPVDMVGLGATKPKPRPNDCFDMVRLGCLATGGVFAEPSSAEDLVGNDNDTSKREEQEGGTESIGQELQGGMDLLRDYAPGDILLCFLWLIALFTTVHSCLLIVDHDNEDAAASTHFSGKVQPSARSVIKQKEPSRSSHSCLVQPTISTLFKKVEEKDERLSKKVKVIDDRKAAKIGETNVLVDAHVLVDKLCRLKMMTSKNFQASQREFVYGLVMEEELLEKLSSFVLTNDEEEAVVLDVEDFNISRQECLRSAVGKVITQKGVNLGGLKASMELAWGYPKGLKVMEVGGGIYQFVFGKESDLLRVIAGGPWLYNNHLIVLHRWEEGLRPEQINFSYSPFWIQLRALPLEFMSIEVGRKMMVGFGEVQEVMMAQLHGNQGRCIRVKVELDITKPIPRGKRVCTADWKPIWVSFRYEKFPLLCHYCGIVGHDDKACMLKYNEAKAGILKENQYGIWLRASPVKGSAKKRSDGWSESSSAESSRAETGQKEAEISARDLRDPTKSGVFEFGRRRIQWESYNAITEVGVGHLGPPLLGPNNSGFNKPGIMSGPRSEPVLKLIEVQGEVQEKAHSEGSIISPEDIMEEDAMMGKGGKAQEKHDKESVQIKETLAASQNIERGKEIERVDELFVKGRLVADSKQKLGARGYKKKPREAVRRGVVEVSHNDAGGERKKRKHEVGLVEVEIKEASNQNQTKKQKVGDRSGVNSGAEMVEEASQKWPQG